MTTDLDCCEYSDRSTDDYGRTIYPDQCGCICHVDEVND